MGWLFRTVAEKTHGFPEQLTVFQKNSQGTQGLFYLLGSGHRLCPEHLEPKGNQEDHAAEALWRNVPAAP